MHKTKAKHTNSALLKYMAEWSIKCWYKMHKVQEIWANAHETCESL